jgi:hypothetical protein
MRPLKGRGDVIFISPLAPPANARDGHSTTAAATAIAITKWIEPVELVVPEASEPVRCQLGVPNRVRYVSVAKVSLQGPRVGPFVGQGIAARMSQHMRMRLNLKPSRLGGALDHAAEA